MNTVYIICWGSAWINDEGNSSAFQVSTEYILL